MLRLPSFKPESTSQTTPIDWRHAAVSIAPLFVLPQFWFSNANDFWMHWPIVPYALLLAFSSVLIIAIFFAAPAIVTQQANRPLHRAIESSLGTVPALGLRMGSITFLVLWMANAISFPAQRWLDLILRRDASSMEFWLLTAAIVGFVCITGLQNTKTVAKQAGFTLKLGFAILIAAMLRVREGLPEAMGGFPPGDYPLTQFGHGLSQVMFHVAPLAFLAGRYGYAVNGRRQLAKTGILGIALPLFAVLLMIGVINVATVKSPFYQPSGNPNLAMALWGKAAGSALPGRLSIVLITMFGALRFGWKALVELATPADTPEGVIAWARLGGLALAIVLLSQQQSAAGPDPDTLTATAACLISAAAVLTADFVSGQAHRPRTQQIDWIGLVALLAGLACIPCWQLGTDAESWAHTWVIPSYATGFLVCLAGRHIQRRWSAGAAPIAAPDSISG